MAFFQIFESNSVGKCKVNAISLTVTTRINVTLCNICLLTKESTVVCVHEWFNVDILLYMLNMIYDVITIYLSEGNMSLLCEIENLYFCCYIIIRFIYFNVIFFYWILDQEVFIMIIIIYHRILNVKKYCVLSSNLMLLLQISYLNKVCTFITHSNSVYNLKIYNNIKDSLYQCDII